MQVEIRNIKRLTKLILFSIFLLVQGTAYSQNNVTRENNEDNDLDIPRKENSKKEELRSGRLSADTIESHIKAWVFQDKLLRNKQFAIDTSMINFHIYDNISKKNLSNARIGNIALASKSNQFFNSLNTSNYIFESPFKEYLFTNEKLLFYSTNLPFTYIFHSSGTKQLNEQVLSIVHTQNISPKMNVGFKYDVINTKGEMTNNSSNINSMGFWTSYLGEKYNLQSNFILNKLKNSENGGINIENFNPETELETNASLDPVNLQAAKMQMNNLGFMLHQKYKLGFSKLVKKEILIDEKDKNNKNPKLLKNDTISYDTIFIPYASLNHTFKINRIFRSYRDVGNAFNEFYPSAIDQVNTYDSTSLIKIENTFQVQFNENQQARFKFRARAFARNEILNHNSNWGGDLPQGDILNPNYLSREKQENYSNSSLGGAIFDYSSKKWNWNFEAEMFLMGRRTGDLNLLGDLERIFSIKKDSFILSIHGSYNLSTPYYLYEQFNSNHYNWSNQFDNESKILANFKFEYPRFQVKTKLELASIDNFIYFGSDAQPTQATENINVLSITVNKNLNLGSFSWNNEVVYQILSDKNILQMPEIIYNTQIYARFYLAKKALKLQAGIEMQYTSTYNLPAYNPALGQFYQNTATTNGLIPTTGGNYPLVSGFINFKVKKVLLFVNYRNIAYLWDKTHHYTSFLYPIEASSFHWGVMWRFYD